MFAITFDLDVSKTDQHHPESVAQAYSDIRSALADHGFRRVQGSLYVDDSDDLAVLYQAITALKALPWFAASVRDIRAFRVEQWSDFTAIVKS